MSDQEGSGSRSKSRSKSPDRRSGGARSKSRSRSPVKDSEPARETSNPGNNLYVANLSYRVCTDFRIYVVKNLMVFLIDI